MKTAIDFVKANIMIREELFCDPVLFNAVRSYESIDSLSEDLEMLQKISSKSFNNKYIINRLKGLDQLLNGINFKTGTLFKDFDLVTSTHPLIISCYILAGQIFSDGNHRVVFKFLESQGLTFDKAAKYIKMIDNARINKNLSWDNIHDFIQLLISNIITVKDKSLNQKIENMFI